MGGLPVKVGDRIKVHISSLNARAQGVARQEGYVVFITGALPGEDCIVQIVTTTKKYAIARLVKRSNDSKLRADAPCPYFGKCGGCQLQHIKYQGQLLYKQKKIIDAIAKISGIKKDVVLPVKGMEHPWAYRNKAIFSVRQMQEGPSAGFYTSNSHALVDIKECLISKKEINQVLSGARDWMNQYHIMGYDEKRKSGDVKGIFARAGENRQVMAGVITSGQQLPLEEAFVIKLRQVNSSIVSIFHNVNCKDTSLPMGDDTRFIWGRNVIEGKIGKLSFEMSPESFYQVNPEQTKVLYDFVADMAGLTGNELVVDAYCGVGTIGQYLAPGAKSVIGIESVGASIGEARENARKNKITNAEYLAGDCRKVFPQLISAGKRPDVVIIDPPRKGCDKEFLDALTAAAPSKIIYVTCNVATMARDIKPLLSTGYTVSRIQPVDMFPQTTHVETVVLMSRVKD